MALPKLAVPTHSLKLPSTGEKIKYRPYLVKEEKMLMMAMESESESEMISAVKNIIESCTDGTLTEKNITMFDLEYLFTNLRAKSVGETSAVMISCQSCEEKNETFVDLSTSYVSGLPESEKAYIVDLNEEMKVKLQYPSVEKVLSFLDEEGISDIDLAYKAIVSSIKEIYSGDEIYDVSEESDEEILEFVNSMNTKQFETIREFIEKGPQVTIDHEFDCAKCQHKNEIKLTGINNFF